MGWTAQGVETIPINEMLTEFKRIVEVEWKRHGVEKIVIGLPKNMKYGRAKSRGVPSLWCNLREMTRNSNRLSWWRLTTMQERMLVEEECFKKKNANKVIDMVGCSHDFAKLFRFKWKSRQGKRKEKMTEHHDHDHEHDHLEGQWRARTHYNHRTERERKFT